MNTQLHTKHTQHTRHGLLRSLTITVICALTLTLFAVPARAQTNTPTGILVLHDNEGQFGWLGDIYSLHLQNLLSHFNMRVTRKPFSSYTAGDLAKYKATFYVGAVWNQTPLPSEFRNDLDTTTNSFVWMGVNLWRYAWNLSNFAPRPEFEQRYGLRLLEHSFDRHPRVDYKGQQLVKDQFDPALSRLEITDPSKVTVYGECFDSTGKSWPYITRSGKFWVVPDMPMISTQFRNRSLVFADALHDMLGVNRTPRHRAVLRIEDVSPDVPVSYLQALRAVLQELKIPFTISLVPQYRDWSGYYNDGKPLFMNIQPNTPFANEIKELVAIGGQVIQHGTTHQIDGIYNPYNGVTADDYEFYRVKADAAGNLTLVGAVSGQTATNIRTRILSGQNEIKNAGLNPVGWLTPHYLATPTAYRQFAQVYPFALDRGIFFAKDSAGKTQAVELNSPFVYRDTYGLKRIPETIGYIDPWGWYELQPPSLPADLIERARALKVVRDSWAGCYFHWYINPNYLRELVNGIKALGFTFVPVNGSLN